MQSLDPLRFVLIGLAGWLNQQQQNVIDYLVEENRVLRDQLGGKRPHLSDNQRRRLAVKAKKIGHQILSEVASFTPDTLMAWHRKLIARKYDGSQKRRRGRPRVMEQIRAHCQVSGGRRQSPDEITVLPPPISTRDHQPCRVAVPSLHPQLS